MKLGKVSLRQQSSPSCGDELDRATSSVEPPCNELSQGSEKLVRGCRLTGALVASKISRLEVFVELARPLSALPRA